MNNLAFTRKVQGKQGKQGKALNLMENYVCLQSQFLGDDHYLTLSSSTALSQWKKS